MKKYVPFVAAVMLAVSFTAFNSFRVAEKEAAPYYFQSTATGSDWHEYTGVECEPGENIPCQISDPTPGGSGIVQLYLSRLATLDNRVFKTQ